MSHGHCLKYQLCLHIDLKLVFGCQRPWSAEQSGCATGHTFSHGAHSEHESGGFAEAELPAGQSQEGVPVLCPPSFTGPVPAASLGSAGVGVPSARGARVGTAKPGLSPRGSVMRMGTLERWLRVRARLSGPGQKGACTLDKRSCFGEIKRS